MEGHVVTVYPAVHTRSYEFSDMWVHSGRGGTCRANRWAVDGYDPTPLPDGSVPVATEPTFRDGDVLAIEPVREIHAHRNRFSFGGWAGQ